MERRRKKSNMHSMSAYVYLCFEFFFFARSLSTFLALLLLLLLLLCFGISFVNHLLRKCSMPSLNLCRRSREWTGALHISLWSHSLTHSHIYTWLDYNMIVKRLKSTSIHFFFGFLCRANYSEFVGTRWRYSKHTDENAIKMGWCFWNI